MVMVLDDLERMARRPGPLPSGLQTARYQVLLEPKYAEWARRQPGGISETVRKALRLYAESQGAHIEDGAQA